MHRNNNVIETIMGAIVLLVAGGFLVFAYRSGQMESINGDAIPIKARFESAAGLSNGSDVRIGGIKVGMVSSMSLDPETYQALVQMRIRKDTKLPRDSSAAIVSDGLLGDKYVEIIPGGDEKTLAAGGMIDYTQSSVNLEQLIGKYMFSGGGVEGGKPSSQDSAKDN